MPVRHSVVLVIAASLLVGLSACAPERTLGDDPSGNASNGAPSDSASPGSPDVEADDAVPVTQSCDELVSAQAIYDFNPNFSLTDEGSADDGGVRCEWVNQSSGDTIVLTASRPSKATFAQLAEESKANSTPAPSMGSEAFFDLASGKGTATVFDKGYVIILSSPFFGEVADAQPLVDAARSGLGL